MPFGRRRFSAARTSYQPHEAKRSDVLVFVLVDKPLVVPDLEPAQTRQGVKLMGSHDCGRVIVMFDVMCCTDIVAVVEEVDSIESHVFH